MTKTIQLFNCPTVQHQRGTALIITLLVISVIAAMAFALARFSLSEVRQTMRAQDSIAAYFSAEAGIEDGLMRYKAISKDTRVAFQRVNFLSPTSDLTKKSDPTLEGLVNTDPGSPPTDKSRYYYDLKMDYLVSSVGSLSGGTPTADSPKLNRDESFEMDLRNMENTNSLTLSWNKPRNSSGPLLRDRVIDGEVRQPFVAMEITPYFEGGGVDWGARKVVYPTGPPPYSYPLPNNDYAFIRFKPFIYYATDPSPQGSSTYRTMKAPDTLLDELQGAYVNFAATNSQNAAVLDSGTTTITSTGYYGGVKRTLQLKIDRQTNTLLGLYDFTLYQGTGTLGQ